jgi:hypothetical protein
VNLSALVWASAAFSVATALVQAAIFGALIRRQSRSDLRVFLSYIALAAGSNLFLAGLAWQIGTSSAQYFYLYWVLNTLLMLLEFGVMSELLTNALKPYTGLIDLGKMVFRWAAVFLLLVAGLTAFATTGTTVAKCLAAVNIIERSLRLMQCGLLLLFLLFERRLALSWRSYSLTLALGIGTTAALTLSLSYLRSYFASWTPVLDVTDTGWSLAIALYWLVCFARTERGRKNVLDSPNKLIFQRWNETLVGAPLHGQAKNPALASMEAFLPGIEKTVDRVLARKIAN